MDWKDEEESGLYLF